MLFSIWVRYLSSRPSRPTIWFISLSLRSLCIGSIFIGTSVCLLALGYLSTNCTMIWLTSWLWLSSRFSCGWFSFICLAIPCSVVGRTLRSSWFRCSERTICWSAVAVGLNVRAWLFISPAGENYAGDASRWGGSWPSSPPTRTWRLHSRPNATSTC